MSQQDETQLGARPGEHLMPAGRFSFRAPSPSRGAIDQCVWLFAGAQKWLRTSATAQPPAGCLRAEQRSYRSASAKSSSIRCSGLKISVKRFGCVVALALMRVESAPSGVSVTVSSPQTGGFRY
jgi:hypothetical protein